LNKTSPPPVDSSTLSCSGIRSAGAAAHLHFENNVDWLFLVGEQRDYNQRVVNEPEVNPRLRQNPFADSSKGQEREKNQHHQSCTRTLLHWFVR
jgi:hypothetical protein